MLQIPFQEVYKNPKNPTQVIHSQSQVWGSSRERALDYASFRGFKLMDMNFPFFKTLEGNLGRLRCNQGEPPFCCKVVRDVSEHVRSFQIFQGGIDPHENHLLTAHN